MILLDEHDVDELATVPLGLAAAAEAARLTAHARVPTGRVQVTSDQAWMRILAGILPGLDLIGYKEFHRVGKRVRYHVSLFRATTGDALGIVDGRRITSLRTASTAAVCARKFFGGRPLSLAIIGSGEEAREGLRAVAGAAAVKALRVYSPTPANREKFAAAAAAEHQVRAEAATSIAETLDGADAAYIATSATAPFLRASDVRGLSFLAAIGSTRPEQRELHGTAVAAAGHVIVDCRDAVSESGDLLEASAGGWAADRAILLGDYLDQPASAPAAGRPVLFKSVGSVEQDLVLAYRLVQAAASRHRGRTTRPVGSLRIMR